MKNNDNSKLDFTKSTILELNKFELTDVKGGSGWVCVTASSAWCGLVVAISTKVNISVMDGH